MNTEIQAFYAPNADITFIMKEETNEHGEPISTECVGWYYGEPTEEDTLYFIGKLKATYD